MEPSDSCTIRIKKTSRDTINEFSVRTHTNVIDFMEQFATELQKLLDIMEDGKKLLYLVDFDNKNKMIHVRLSDALMSSFAEIDPSMKEEILRAFGYDEKFHDLREKEKPQPPPEEFFDNKVKA